MAFLLSFQVTLFLLAAKLIGIGAGGAAGAGSATSNQGGGGSGGGAFCGINAPANVLRGDTLVVSVAPTGATTVKNDASTTIINVSAGGAALGRIGGASFEQSLLVQWD